MVGGTVVVIGAGAIGLAVTRQLAVLGRRVVLVDGGEPGSGTTGTSFAWLNANGKSPDAYYELNLAGLDAYHRIAERGGGGDWLRLTGHLEWAATEEKRHELDDRSRRLRDRGYPVVTLSAHQAIRMEPDLRVPPTSDVCYFPEEGHVLTDRFVTGMVRQLSAMDVELVLGRPVVGFESRGDRIVAAVLSDGTRLAGATFVSCVGRRTEGLARLADSYVPMLKASQGSRALGILGYSSRVTTKLTHVVSSPRLNVRPGAEGHVVLQATDLDRHAVPDSIPTLDGAEARELLRRAADLLVGFDGASMESMRVGYRAIPADGLTVAGWAPAVEGLYILATHSGITLAVILGELAAREIASAVEEPLLGYFRPARFAEPVAQIDQPVH